MSKQMENQENQKGGEKSCQDFGLLNPQSGETLRNLPELNEVALAGRLVNAPTVKDFGEDKLRAQFILGVPKPRREGVEKPIGVRAMDFVVVTAWRTMARECAKLRKGDGIQIQGRLRSWKDEHDREASGRARFRLNVEADMLQILDRGLLQLAHPSPQTGKTDEGEEIA